MARKAARALMPTLPTGSKRPARGTSERHGGFTLLELLVVLVLIVVLSSVVTVNIGPALREARLRAGARQLLAQLQYARSVAITQQTTAAVLFDTTREGTSVMTLSTGADGAGTWQPDTSAAGRFRALPNGVQLATVTVDPGSAAPGAGTTATTPNGTGTLISFSVLGQGQNAQVILQETSDAATASAPVNQRVVLVDAVTGQCAIANNTGTTNGQTATTQ